MALTVGQQGKPFEMRIEAGKIREFAMATVCDNPAYFGDTAVVPPTFLMTSAFWTSPENAAWGHERPNFERLLHGEQEFTFHGQLPRAGSRLTGVAKIADVYEKEGKRGGIMKFIETVTEYRDENGTLLAQSKATLIETGMPTAVSRSE